MTNFSGKPLSPKTGNAGCGGPQGGGVDSRRNGVSEVSPKYLAEVASNAIRSGYKQTEVGVIPADWDAVCLGDVSEVRMCKRILAGQTQKIGAIPFFKIGTFGGEPDAFIPQFLYEDFKAKYSFPDKGDILISAAGTLGKSVIYDGMPAYFQDSNIVWLKVNQRKLLNEYLYHYYKVIKWASSEGSTIARLYNGIIRASMIALPATHEQTAIANALSDVDALISELEKLIAKKQAIKTATMQQLLTGRTRLPQFALREDGTPKGNKPSELGEIPEDWEIVCFDQLKDKKDNWAITGGPFGSNLKASDYTENGVRVIQLQNIGDGVFKNDDFVYTSYKKANELISCNIYPDEIILSKMGDPVARACLIPHFHSRYVMCSDGIRLKVDSQRYSEKFVFYFLNYPLFRNQALDASTGSTRKRIGLSELRDLLLFAPPKEEQTAIATILSDMDEEIQALEQRLGKTRQIKQGMMQELLTGKTRLIQGSEVR